MTAMDQPGPFETIESAQEFMSLLGESAHEAMVEIECDLQGAIDSAADRREKALRIAILKMKQLLFHIHRTQRILNDLRTLRRLLREATREAHAGGDYS